ncbi:MAG: hypothetical protein AB7V62_04010 [Thermoleophilia bacterium]
MTAAGGSCYGYDVAGPLPLRFLRAPGGEPLRVYEHDEEGPGPDAVLFEEWEPDDLVPIRVRLYECGPRWRVWIEGAGWYHIDPREPSIGVPVGEDPVRREERLWGLPVLLCFLHRGDLPLHAAVVQVGDGALVVGAPSTFGKTTLAAACWRAGHRVLGDDLACVRGGDEPAVIPGPALLRLRPDMAERLGLDEEDEVIDLAGRVRVVLGGDRLGDCAPVPLRGVVLLGEESDEVSVAPVGPVEAIRDLWELSFHLSRREDDARSFAAMADLTARVPVWRLRRPLSVESLPAVVDRIAGLVAARA